MRPIRTDQATGTYQAPDGLEAVVGGLPFWRERDSDGLPVIRSVWALDADEKEAIALGGTVLLGIVGEPIPPVSLEVLSPIDVPAFGMPALDPLHVDGDDAVVLSEADAKAMRDLSRSIYTSLAPIEHGEIDGGFDAAASWYELQGDAGAAAGWIAAAILLGVILALLAIGFIGRVTA